MIRITYNITIDGYKLNKFDCNVENSDNLRKNQCWSWEADNDVIVTGTINISQRN